MIKYLLTEVLELRRREANFEVLRKVYWLRSLFRRPKEERALIGDDLCV